MKVDCYQSKAKPSYGVVVPSGNDLSLLAGDAGAAVANLQPLVLQKKSVELESIAVGDLQTYLEKQIAESGAGLMRTQVDFIEVSK